MLATALTMKNLIDVTVTAENTPAGWTERCCGVVWVSGECHGARAGHAYRHTIKIRDVLMRVFHSVRQAL